MDRVSVLAVLALATAAVLTACSSPPETVRTWTTPDGTPVSPSVIRLRSGDAHCGWEKVWFLSMGDPIGSEGWASRNTNRFMMFVQDPENAFSGDQLRDDFDPDAELPPDAEFTGYMTDGDELWVNPAQIDSAIYMVTEFSVEKWPRAETPIFCD